VAPFELVAPRTTEEAVAELRAAAGSAVGVLAGGSDLLIDIDGGRAAPTKVVSLRRLPWRTLDWVGGALTIGSTLPLRTLEDDPEVRRRLPGLWQAVRAVGSVALRHRATMGGNLGRAAPSSDLIPMLLALDAEVELVGPDGSRRLPVDQFVLASRRTALRPAELIRSIRIAEARPSAFLWQRVRPANDISQLAVAVARSPGSGAWSVAVGGIPPRAVLLPRVGESLGRGAPSPDELDRAADRATREVAIVADRRASEEYRRRLVGTLLRRAIAEAVESSP
jgi:aerobic carbon-monoxide dehydrogenase medium subunit